MNDPLSRHVPTGARRGDLLSEHCPSREVFKHVTSRWGMLLLMALRDGAHRFSELRRKIGGINERMLAQTLVWLEQDGFVQRIVHSVVPPHVEYRLTPLGEGIACKAAELLDWIEVNLDGIVQAQRQVAERTKQRPLDAVSEGAVGMVAAGASGR
jgi:DNA-binding HxlR family transcriptional regulator